MLPIQSHLFELLADRFHVGAAKAVSRALIALFSALPWFVIFPEVGRRMGAVELASFYCPHSSAY